MFEQLCEEPLGPFVVFRIGRDGLAFPIEHRAHAAQLLPHVVDVGIRPRLGMDAALDSGILGGQAKRIEADREHDVVAVHAQIARARIRRRHDVPVADVQIAAGIGQHRQEVELLLSVIDHRAIQLILLPLRLPLRLDRARLVITDRRRHRHGLDRRDSGRSTGLRVDLAIRHNNAIDAHASRFLGDGLLCNWLLRRRFLRRWLSSGLGFRRSLGLCSRFLWRGWLGCSLRFSRRFGLQRGLGRSRLLRRCLL
jgi:hypothetical protein